MNVKHRLLFTSLCLSLTISLAHAGSSPADDEQIILFNGSAYLSPDESTWLVPIHAWILEPTDSTSRRALFEAVLKSEFEISATAETEPNLSRRLNAFLADNERGKRIEVSLLGKTYLLPETAENGHVFETLQLPVEAVTTDRAKVETNYTNPLQQTTAWIEFTRPQGVTVISDIDDTVKISHVTDHKKLLEATFLLDFEAVPGMPELYQKWRQQGASFQFVSSSPWHLYTELDQFLGATGFPLASLNLKAIRFRDRTILSLFKKGTETKPLQIKPILERYPQRKFVLIGDSGEQDPEVYSQFYHEHPEKILAIFIRNINNDLATNKRILEIFSGIPKYRWHLFSSPAELPEKLNLITN